MTSPVLNSIFEGDRDVEAKLEFLLEMHPQWVREKDPSSGNLPLHEACSCFSWKLSHIKQLFELYPDAVAIRNV